MSEGFRVCVGLWMEAKVAGWDGVGCCMYCEGVEMLRGKLRTRLDLRTDGRMG